MNKLVVLHGKTISTDISWSKASFGVKERSSDRAQDSYLTCESRLVVALWCTSGVASPKTWGGQNVWFQANNTILFKKNASQTTKWLYFLKISGAHGPFGSSLAMPMWFTRLKIWDYDFCSVLQIFSGNVKIV